MNKYLISLAILGAMLLSIEPSASNSSACEQPANTCVDGKLLHVPSPDWRDQVVYFLMIDRFSDGDPSRNDLGHSLYRPDEEGAYSGGDLQGVIDRLDYIETLGATAVWTTPPFANQWWSDSQHYGGYHGYWPRDFSKVDEHFGTLETYQDLSHQLHARDMYLIMDIVVNHVGNYFEYNDSYDPSDATKGYSFAGNTVPSSAPVMPPFDLNDPTNPAHREAAIYHWTPPLKTFEHPSQELIFQLGGLDDINTRNPKVREVFKKVFADWIRNVGVDSYRIDTVKYVEPDFWTDFLHSSDGVHSSAKLTGRDNFWVFGEVKESSAPFTDTGEAKIKRYLSNELKPQFDSLINFPLQEELVRVVAEGSPTRLLTDRLHTAMRTFDDLTLQPNFVSNHDVPRFGSQASETSFRQALALMFALPGVPILYQGDEQNLLDSRQAMFAGGYLSPASHFKPTSAMYQYVQSLIALRKNQVVMRRGDLTILKDNPVDSGAFVFSRTYQGETLLFTFNTAAHSSLAAGVDVGVANSVLQPIHNAEQDIKVSNSANVNLVLPAHAFQIYKVIKPANESKVVAAQSRGQIKILQGLPGAELTSGHTIRGTALGTQGELLLVNNGNLDNASVVQVDELGQWAVDIAVQDLGEHRHSIELFAPQSNIVSEPVIYQTTLDKAAWCTTVDDAKGHDNRLGYSYRLPSNDSFQYQQDIRKVSACGAGDVMELTIKMGQLSDGWLPVNGFDHVAFTILFDFPKADSGKRFDELNLPTPKGFKWSHANVVYGWGNYLLAYPGTKIGRSPMVKADKQQKEIKLTFKASDFGQTDWRDVKLMVTTWDRAGEGGLRTISQSGAEYDYAGDPNGAKVMDATSLDISY